MQLLPFCPSDVIDRVEANVAKLEPVTTMLAKGMTPEDVIAIALDGMGFDVLDTYEPTYRCACSHKKVEGALLAIPREERLSLADENDAAEVTCRFCDKVYRFTREDLAALDK